MSLPLITSYSDVALKSVLCLTCPSSVLIFGLSAANCSIRYLCSFIFSELLLTINVTEVTVELAKATAKAIRSGMWEWHYIFGLFLAISVLIRIYMMLSKKAQMPLTKLIEAPKEKKLQYAVYLFLCFFIMMMTLSGGFLYYHEALGFTKYSIGWVKRLMNL